MHDPDTFVLVSPGGRKLGRWVTRGVPALLLALLLGALVASFSGRLRMYARMRITGGVPYHAERVQVLSAAWLEPDLYRITVRLSHHEDKLLFGQYGIRLTDVSPGGFGEISDYRARTLPPSPPSTTVDVVAYQRLPEVPRGPLTLRIDGYHHVPRFIEPAWVRYFLGPVPPRPAVARYRLAGGAVTLPPPPRPAGQKSAAD